MIDKFALYHDICNLQKLTESYIEGKEYAEQLQVISEQLSQRKYRVAVVGEFKRGKSSLVNCILGTEILPTDILPTTAVVNRIVYDTEEKIVIRYKNGETEESNLSRIVDYATKLDEEKERFAATIKEIDVHYPSLFCQNNIELFDTPGLNDDDAMTKATVDILDNIDTAIVVISAMMPLSMTEQNLICTLLECKDIYHLTFVVSFIDKISDDTDEQDRVVELIKERLQNDTYERFCKKNSDDSDLIEKAGDILKNPAIFAVSAKQAIQGFIKGDKKLLEKSRFAHFKFQLSALLTANQELDILQKTKRITKELYNGFDTWNQNLQNKLDSMWTETNNELANITKYQKRWFNMLTEKIWEAGTYLKNKQILVDAGKENDHEMIKQAERVFIEHISRIREDEFCEEKVKATLKEAAEACCKEISGLYEDYRIVTKGRLEAVNKFFSEMRKPYNLEEERLNDKLEKWRKECIFPEFEISAEEIIAEMTDLCGECMPHIKKAVMNATKQYYVKVREFIMSWRVILLQHQSEDDDNIEFEISKFNNNLKILSEMNKTRMNNYPEQKKMIEEVYSSVMAIEI